MGRRVQAWFCVITMTAILLLLFSQFQVFPTFGEEHAERKENIQPFNKRVEWDNPDPHTPIGGEEHVERKENLQPFNKIWTDVLIVGYKRTGSTFLGKVIGWRDDVFYWHEPLRKNKDWKYFKDKDLLCNYHFPICERTVDGTDDSSSAALSLMEDIFHCRLSKHDDKPTNINLYSFRRPTNWDTYANCKLQQNNYPGCIKHLENACIVAKHRTIKVVRINLNRASDMLNTNPQLKIVHLFRDPRGTINSHLSTDWYKEILDPRVGIINDIKVLCSRLQDDIKIGKTLVAKYPTRVKLVQYEDVGSILKIKRLYEFLEMGISHQTDIFLEKIFDLPADGKRGSFNPFSYRETLEWSTVQLVNTYCGDIFTQLGLRKFNTEEEYRNTNTSVIIDKLPYAL